MGKMKDLFYHDKEKENTIEQTGLGAWLKSKFKKVWDAIKRDLARSAEYERRRCERHHEHLRNYYDRIGWK